MEQPCYKCGQIVEEGAAFCPHCSAPQIRVVIAEPAPAFPPSADATATSSHSAILPPAQTVPAVALPMRWSHTVRPCALAALVASLLMVLGLYPWVAMASVGFLAVVFYRLRPPGTPISAGVGARLGALGGLLWFGMSVILQGILVVVLRKGPEIREEMLKKIQQTASGANDPQVQALFDYFKSPTGLTVMIVLAVVLAFVSALVLGALGGALGAAILGRRDKP
jgi:hypothetical protein